MHKMIDVTEENHQPRPIGNEIKILWGTVLFDFLLKLSYKIVYHNATCTCMFRRDVLWYWSVVFPSCLLFIFILYQYSPWDKFIVFIDM